MAADDVLAQAKDLAARAAVRRVRAGMKIALGTGSTAAYAVRALSEKFRGESLDLVASSRLTEELSGSLGLKVRPLRADDRFELMLDGADEVTPRLELTKGGGGALFREKLLARLSKELLVMVDPTKLVSHLGSRSALPIEVVPYARPVVARELSGRGYGVALRGGEAGWRTDNGNEILDLRAPQPVEDAAALEAELRAIPGVVETGIFVGLAHRVYVGLPNGTVQEIVPAARRSD